MLLKFNVGRRAPFVAAFLSFLLYWASLPPSWIGWAAFLVPGVWAATIFNSGFNAFVGRNSKNAATAGNSEDGEAGKKRRFAKSRRLARFFGRVFFGGEYRQYWTAAFCFWAATVVWISYPHPATTLGWLAASAYLAIYFPLFVAITRALAGFSTKEKAKNAAASGIAETGQSGEDGETAQVEQTTKRFGLPLWLAAPIAWTAVEWLRNRGLGGFSFAGLSHSLYDFLQFIQIAEPFGEYGVGAAIVAIGTLLGMAVAALSGGGANKAGAVSRDKSANGAKWASVAFSLCGAGAVFAAVVGFGVRRLEFFDAAERAALETGAVPCRVALLQDGTTYRFPVSERQNGQVEGTYLALAAEAARSETPFDVVVWPESCFDVFWDEKTTTKSVNRENGVSAEVSANRAGGGRLASAATGEIERIERAEKSQALARSRRDAAKLTERLGASAILGTTALIVDVDAGDETTVFNAAVFAPRLDLTTVAAFEGEYVDFNADVPRNETQEMGKTGEKEGWAKYVDWKTPASTAPNDPNPAIFRLYGKRRLVICGEYIPGADLLPDWFPLKAVCADFSLERGAGPVVFPVVRRGVSTENAGNAQDVRNTQNRRNAQTEPLLFAPHICFESSIPHYVKEQVRELTAVGAEPDVLVCLSNDGWFRNGSQTDGHLATQVFRAVENRKPVVAATHGGFSAHVDQAGRVRSRGARRGTEVVAAEVLPVDCERFGRTALIGGRDLAETFALGCVWLGLGALVVRKVGGRREKTRN